MGAYGREEEELALEVELLEGREPEDVVPAVCCAAAARAAAAKAVFRCAGTLRLMFSRASRRSAWKSGWRNVQLCEDGVRLVVYKRNVEPKWKDAHAPRIGYHPCSSLCGNRTCLTAARNWQSLNA